MATTEHSENAVPGENSVRAGRMSRKPRELAESGSLNQKPKPKTKFKAHTKSPNQNPQSTGKGFLALKSSTPVTMKERMPPSTRPLLARAPRVRILPLHKLSFKLDHHPSVTPLPVNNLSITGVGFVRSAWNEWPPPGSRLPGQLLIGDHSIPTTLKIIHQSALVIGASFVENVDTVRVAIVRHFDVEVEALEMVPVRDSFLKVEADGQPHLIAGLHNCEMFYIENAGKLVRFSLCFFGNYFEGGKGQPPRYGQVIGDPDGRSLGYPMANLIRWVTDVPSEMITRAVRFVENIEPLNPTYRAAIIESIKKL